MTEIVIRSVDSGQDEWERLIHYAQNCSWRAGASLAKAMREGAFTEWERVFAAMLGEEIAGYCTLAKTDCIENLPYTPYIGYVFVGEKFRGFRLSGRLISSAEEYARSIGYDCVYLISDHENFYEKYGFEVTDRAVAPWGAEEKIYRKQI